MELQSVDDDFDDERQVGQLLPGFRLELGAGLGAKAGNTREIDLEEGSDMSGAPPGGDHVLAR